MKNNRERQIKREYIRDIKAVMLSCNSRFRRHRHGMEETYVTVRQWYYDEDLSRIYKIYVTLSLEEETLIRPRKGIVMFV